MPVKGDGAMFEVLVLRECRYSTVAILSGLSLKVALPSRDSCLVSGMSSIYLTVSVRQVPLAVVIRPVPGQFDAA